MLSCFWMVTVREKFIVIYILLDGHVMEATLEEGKFPKHPLLLFACCSRCLVNITHEE